MRKYILPVFLGLLAVAGITFAETNGDSGGWYFDGTNATIDQNVSIPGDLTVSGTFTASGMGDLLADGTVPLTADWDVGLFDITAVEFKGALIGNADTVTTNANLTGIVTSVGNATSIADKAIGVAKLSDGTDGELITWDASGVAATVGAGTANQVLTSNGAGAAPTFQDAAGGAEYTSTSFLLGEDFAEGEAGYLIDINILSESGTGNENLGNTSNLEKQGQTFYCVKDLDVNQITIKPYKVGSPTDNLVVKIYQSDKSTLLGTSSSVSGSTLTTSPVETSFTFSSAVSLSATTEYFFEISRSGSLDVSNFYRITRDTGGNPYSGGAMFIYNSSWSESTNNDIWFKVMQTSGNLNALKTDADGSGDQLLPFGYATAAGSAGETVAFATSGVATISPTDSPSVNETMYLSNTAGEVQASAGSTSVKVGRMISDTEMLIIPPPL